jgi:hypothetical protein
MLEDKDARHAAADLANAPGAVNGGLTGPARRRFGRYLDLAGARTVRSGW